jgi:ankyrin repeat protein
MLYCNLSSGHVLLLAKEWMPEALLTQEAAVFIAAILQYLSEEVVELSGNAAQDNMSAVICPRFMLLAIESDDDIAAVFRGIVFRDSAMLPRKAYRIFALAPMADNDPDNGEDANDAEYDPEIPLDHRTFEHMFRAKFGGYGRYLARYSAADARNGYRFIQDEQGYVMSPLANISSVPTRWQEQLETIRSLTSRARDLLAKEFPLSTSRADIMRLSPKHVRASLGRDIQMEAQSTLCCIDRRALQSIIRVHAPSMSLTHEALNVLLIAVQDFVRRLLYSVVSSTTMMQRGMVELADVTSARRIMTVFHAVRASDLTTLEEQIVQQQFDVNLISNGETALIAACSSGRLASVHWLVAHGATIDQAVGRKTALLTAAVRGKTDIVRLLLDLGANINSRAGDGTLLTCMCKAGDAHVEFIKELIARGVNVNDKDDRGADALHVACSNNQFAAAEAVIFGGIDITTKVKGRTAVEKVVDAEMQQRLKFCIQQMEEPGFK